MIHNAFQALNFDISKIRRVLEIRIFTKIEWINTALFTSNYAHIGAKGASKTHWNIF